MSVEGPLTVAIGLVAGVLSGMFGIGGALVTTPAIRLLLGRPELIAVGTPLPVIIPTAVAGALAYARRGLGFAQALTVLTTVTSRPSPEQVITDAGLKSVTPEHGMPLVVGHEELECHALSEEHGRLRSTHGPVAGLQIGELLEFVPGHGCTTMNLHDQVYALRHGRVEAIWEIAGRGKVR